jgi:hypothetical protein
MAAVSGVAAPRLRRERRRRRAAVERAFDAVTSMVDARIAVLSVEERERFRELVRRGGETSVPPDPSEAPLDDAENAELQSFSEWFSDGIGRPTLTAWNRQGEPDDDSDGG